MSTTAAPFPTRRVATGLVVAALLGAWAIRGPLVDSTTRRGAEALASWQLLRASRLLGVACRLRGPVETCLDRVQVHLWRGDIRAARRHLAAIAPRIDGRTATAARYLDLRGVAALGAAEVEQAERLHRRALTVPGIADAPSVRGRARINLARALTTQLGTARLDEARSLLERVRDQAAARRDAVQVADALRNLGVVHWFRGQLDAPEIRFYRPALHRYRALGHRRGEAITLSNLALLASQRGDIDSSLKLLRESLSIKEQIGDLAGAGESLTYLGGTVMMLRNDRRAMAYFERSLRLHRQLGYRIGALDTEGRISTLPGTASRTPSRVGAEEERAFATGIVVAANVGRRRAMAGDIEGAREILFQALEESTAHRLDDTRHAILLLLARLAAEAQDWTGVRAYLDQAGAIETETRSFSGQLSREALLGMLAWREGRPREALRRFRRRIELESQNLDNASDLLVRSTTRPYREFFSFLLELPADRLPGIDRARLALTSLERMRARALRRAVDHRPDGSEIALDVAARTDVTDPFDPARLQRVLRDDQAVIAFLMGIDVVGAVVVTRTTSHLHRLPLTPDQVESKVTLFRHLLQRDGSPDWLPLAHDLYQRLIAPLTEHHPVDATRRWALLPFGSLHDLPFAALALDPAGEELLLDRRVVHLLPSARFLLETRTPREDGPSYAFGHPGAGRTALPMLRHAEEEAGRVAAILGGHAWTGRSAGEARFRALAPVARRLHLAAHGLSEAHRPLASRVVLEGGGGEDGDLTVAEILELPIDAELVTLSACWTARRLTAAGGRRHEADRIGLADAFLHAGAGSVLASLAPSDDRISKILMEAFYRGLQQEQDPATALASAQRAIRRGTLSPRARDRHPGRWASFVLLGNGS